MSEVNMFELAVKNKFRFGTSAGQLTVEDLWDLKLTSSTPLSLDTLAKTLNKQIKEEEEESFVVKKSTSNNLLELKFEIVKHVISVKIKEREVATEAVKKKAERELILGLINDKENEELKGLSIDDLKARL